MAAGNGVWGIDIGQCGLKALRASSADGGATIVCDAFDFIEYPKILSQPDAKPDDLIRDALKQFLGRNDLRGDKVAISLSGQSGLARFVKLPPVESKMIPKMVAYEAKQQIPFSLDDVIWDYQQMPGSTEEEGFALETEVGIFAMKRDQVFRAIRPLVDAEVELDIIQLTPLCIYNAIAFDQLGDVNVSEDEPRKSIVILSMGTDSSDLVVTDGFSVWQRSIPLGGNHFTKQLTTELKLTFAKAEHVKRNAREADDAKEIFQAMRPVFNDLVTEIHRSLGYFQSLDRERGENLSHIVALGNAVKLPGLPQYLSKNLDYKVVKLDHFKRLTGPSVVEAPVFKDNVLAFPVCYGLALQGLGKANLSTSLLPREILRSRLIRRKKPWAAAIAAALLLACAFNFFFHWRAWNGVHQDHKVDGITWAAAHKKVKALSNRSGSFKTTDDAQNQRLARLNKLGEAAVGSSDGRLLWLELLKVISEALPQDPNLQPGQLTTLDARPMAQRPEIYIESIESVYFEDLSTWYQAIQETYAQQRRARQMGKLTADSNAEADTSDEAAPDAADAVEPDNGDPLDAEVPGGSEVADDAVPTVSGPGWVIEVFGRHFYEQQRGSPYVINTLVKHLDEGEVELPIDAEGGTMVFRTRELGILCPTLTYGRDNRNFSIPDPNPSKVAGAQPPEAGNQVNRLLRGSGANRQAERREISAPCFEFKVQFAWTQVRLKQRLEAREKQPQSSTEVVTAGAEGGF